MNTHIIQQKGLPVHKMSTDSHPEMLVLAIWVGIIHQPRLEGLANRKDGSR
jgi:hypothetical protein